MHIFLFLLLRTMSRRGRLVSLGNYTLENVLLGEGGFGRVELATHVITKIPVALKIIDKEKTDSYTRKNLYREANILGRLHHPNILRLLEILSTDTLLCFVLEYVAHSRTLHDVLAESGRFSETTTRTLAAQLCRALHYLHGRRVLHRDLKLDNILVNRETTECYLIDFGLSTLWHHGKLMKTHCGSLEYAAPELFSRDKFYGPPVDIWSLGVVLYAMLLGSPSFIVVEI